MIRESDICRSTACFRAGRPNGCLKQSREGGAGVMDIDVLVVGSGGAGMLAAATAAAAGQRTVLLSKCQVARSGATATITGDCSVDGKTCVDLLGLKADPNDDEQAFFEDTIKGGRFLNDQRLVEDMIARVGP